jgi:hypothetical protein
MINKNREHLSSARGIRIRGTINPAKPKEQLLFLISGWQVNDIGYGNTVLVVPSAVERVQKLLLYSCRVTLLCGVWSVDKLECVIDAIYLKQTSGRSSASCATQPAAICWPAQQRQQLQGGKRKPKTQLSGSDISLSSLSRERALLVLYCLDVEAS